MPALAVSRKTKRDRSEGFTSKRRRIPAEMPRRPLKRLKPVFEVPLLCSPKRSNKAIPRFRRLLASCNSLLSCERKRANPITWFKGHPVSMLSIDGPRKVGRARGSTKSHTSRLIFRWNVSEPQLVISYFHLNMPLCPCPLPVEPPGMRKDKTRLCLVSTNTKLIETSVELQHTRGGLAV